MYTLQNSVCDILADGLEEKGLYLFCPELWSEAATEWRLESVDVPVLYRRYPRGGHGCALGAGTGCEGWIAAMAAWMTEN